MNRKTLPFVLVLGILLLLMSTSVVAQRVRVADIPFNFTVCHEQLPAGKYEVRPFSSVNPHVLLIRSEDKRSVEIFCTHDVQSQKRPTTGKLIFNRYGNQYFLSELWMQGEMTGSQVPPTEEEQAILRELKDVRKRERVTIKVTEAKPNN